MMLRSPLPLAKAYGQHLDDAAFVSAPEIGVWLDPRQGHHHIGCQSIGIPMHRFAEGSAANHGAGHIGLHRHTQIRLGNAILGQQVTLALGIRPTMASHGCDNERLTTLGTEEGDCFPGHHSDANDSPAANANGHGLSRTKALCQGGCFPGLTHSLGNMGYFGLILDLANKAKLWQFH